MASDERYLCHYPPDLKAIGDIAIASFFCVYVYICTSLGRFFVIWVSFEKLKTDCNQTWVKDAIGVPSYDNEVKGHDKVKGHPEVKLGGKCWFSLVGSPLKKLKVRLEPNLGQKCNRGSFVCYCDQRSYTKVRGCLRSS